MHARWHTQSRSPSAHAAPPSRPLPHRIPAPGVRPTVFKIMRALNRTAPPAPSLPPSRPTVVSFHHKPATLRPPTMVSIFNPSRLQHCAYPHGSPWMTPGNRPITLPIGSRIRQAQRAVWYFVAHGVLFGSAMDGKSKRVPRGRRYRSPHGCTVSYARPIQPGDPCATRVRTLHTPVARRRRVGAPTSYARGPPAPRWVGGAPQVRRNSRMLVVVADRLLASYASCHSTRYDFVRSCKHAHESC